MEAKNLQNGGLGAVWGDPVAYWGHLGVRGGPRRVPRSIFRAKMRAQGLQNEIKIEPKSHQQIGVFAGSFFEVIVEGFWSQN